MGRRRAIDQARDYVRYMHKPFTYRDLMRDLGIARRSAHRCVAMLVDELEVVSIGRDGEGIYRATSERQRKKLEAERDKKRREKGRRRMQENGEKWLKRLHGLGAECGEVARRRDGEMVRGGEDGTR